MYVHPYGTRVVPEMITVFEGARPDVEGDQQQALTVEYCSLGRQAAGATQLHFPHPQSNPDRSGPSAENPIAQAVKQRPIRRRKELARAELRARTILRDQVAARCTYLRRH